MLAMASCSGPHHRGAHWNYEGATGPAHWGDLSPESALCNCGRNQSPIDIRKTRKAQLGSIVFAYKDTPVRIVNNLHTIQETASTPAHESPYRTHGHTVHDESQSTMTVEGKTYELMQFHFHSPSEHTVDGKHYDMEAHFVHKSERGEIAVVGVFMKKGAENGLVRTLWQSLPEEANKEKVVADVLVNAADLLPGDRSYYRYDGSFTTPPCTEGVAWIVMTTPIEASAAQIETFKSTMGCGNNRPVQPLNERVVFESE